ncbi:hypothetical protein Q6247_27320, partial [Klebsiella pneumoniae]
VFPNSGELFGRHCSSPTESEHTILFVSSISFHFAVHARDRASFPGFPSSSLFLLFLATGTVTVLLFLLFLFVRTPLC